jgi:hypothetical protein
MTCVVESVHVSQLNPLIWGEEIHVSLVIPWLIDAEYCNYNFLLMGRHFLKQATVSETNKWQWHPVCGLNILCIALMTCTPITDCCKKYPISAVCILASWFFLTAHVSLPNMAVGTAIILYNFSCDSNLAFPFMTLLIVTHTNLVIFLSISSVSVLIYGLGK